MILWYNFDGYWYPSQPAFPEVDGLTERNGCGEVYEYGDYYYGCLFMDQQGGDPTICHISRWKKDFTESGVRFTSLDDSNAPDAAANRVTATAHGSFNNSVCRAGSNIVVFYAYDHTHVYDNDLYHGTPKALYWLGVSVFSMETNTWVYHSPRTYDESAPVSQYNLSVSADTDTYAGYNVTTKISYACSGTRICYNPSTNSILAWYHGMHDHVKEVDETNISVTIVNQPKLQIFSLSSYTWGAASDISGVTGYQIPLSSLYDVAGNYHLVWAQTNTRWWLWDPATNDTSITWWISHNGAASQIPISTYLYNTEDNKKYTSLNVRLVGTFGSPLDVGEALLFGSRILIPYIASGGYAAIYDTSITGSGGTSYTLSTLAKVNQEIYSWGSYTPIALSNVAGTCTAIIGEAGYTPPALYLSTRNTDGSWEDPTSFAYVHSQYLRGTQKTGGAYIIVSQSGIYHPYGDIPDEPEPPAPVYGSNDAMLVIDLSPNRGRR